MTAAQAVRQHPCEKAAVVTNNERDWGQIEWSLQHIKVGIASHNGAHSHIMMRITVPLGSSNCSFPLETDSRSQSNKHSSHLKRKKRYIYNWKNLQEYALPTTRNLFRCILIEGSLPLIQLLWFSPCLQNINAKHFTSQHTSSHLSQELKKSRMPDTYHFPLDMVHPWKHDREQDITPQVRLSM